MGLDEVFNLVGRKLLGIIGKFMKCSRMLLWKRLIPKIQNSRWGNLDLRHVLLTIVDLQVIQFFVPLLHLFTVSGTE
jgi:hypothetical protein